MRTSLAPDVLEMAVGERRPQTRGLLVHHSDQGSRYTSGEFGEFGETLSEHGLLCSVDTVGGAYVKPFATRLDARSRTATITCYN